MTYVKTIWANDQAPAVDATNLNKIETGIFDAHALAADAQADADTALARPLGAMTLLDDYTVSVSVLAVYDTNTRLGGNLPTGYKHLRLLVVARSDAGARYHKVRFNNDATAIYNRQRLIAAGASSNVEQLTALTEIDCGMISDNTDTAGRVGRSEILVPDYLGTTWRKGLTAVGGGFSGGSQYAGTWSGECSITAAITRLQLIPSAGNYSIGTRFSLYGIS